MRLFSTSQGFENDTERLISRNKNMKISDIVLFLMGLIAAGVLIAAQIFMWKYIIAKMKNDTEQHWMLLILLIMLFLFELVGFLNVLGL